MSALQPCLVRGDCRWARRVARGFRRHLRIRGRCRRRSWDCRSAGRRTRLRRGFVRGVGPCARTHVRLAAEVGAVVVLREFTG